MARIGDDLVQGLKNIGVELGVSFSAARNMVYQREITAFKLNGQWTIIPSEVRAEIRRRAGLDIEAEPTSDRALEQRLEAFGNGEDNRASSS